MSRFAAVILAVLFLLAWESVFGRTDQGGLLAAIGVGLAFLIIVLVKHYKPREPFGPQPPTDLTARSQEPAQAERTASTRSEDRVGGLRVGAGPRTLGLVFAGICCLLAVRAWLYPMTGPADGVASLSLNFFYHAFGPRGPVFMYGIGAIFFLAIAFQRK